MKKIIAVILVVLMLNISDVFAEEMPVFSIGNTNAQCGDEITVDIDLNNKCDISSFTIDIGYDSEYLELLSADKTELLDGQMVFNPNYSDNVLRIVYASHHNISNTGNIIKLKFKVNAHKQGGTVLELAGTTNFVGNEELQTVTASFINGRITIAENPNYVEEPEKKIKVSNVNCNYGEQSVILINTDDILNAESGKFSIYYNAALEIISCEKGGILGNCDVEIDNISAENKIKVTFQGTTPVTTKGTIFKLTVSVKNDLTKVYEVSVKDISMKKADGAYLNITATSGFVSSNSEQSTSVGGSHANTGTTVDENKDDKEDKDDNTETNPPENDTKPTVYNNTFKDVSLNSWYYDDVKFIYEKNVMRGTTEDLFEPDASLSRAMIVTMLYRLEGEPSTEDCAFDDVKKGEWYEKSVAWANNNKIVKGIGNNLFAPNDDITRQELATIIYNYKKFKNEIADKVSVTESFADMDSVSDWAKDGIDWAIVNKIMLGKENKQLDPNGKVTRAESAAMFRRSI